MLYDNIDNIDDEYNPLEDTGSTAYWQNEWEQEKIRKEEEEQEKIKNFKIYFCSNCGFVFDEKKVGNTVEEVLKNQYKPGKCPYCHKEGCFKETLEKEINELKKKLKNKKKTEQEKKKDIIEENIKDDVEDLLQDLSTRLMKGKLSPKSFVNVFYNLSVNIAKRYSKDLPGSLDPSYYKNILALCDTTLDLYNVNEDAETILQSMDKDIEQNKLYLAEYEYYINDDKYSISNFEMSERIAEYENMKDNIFKQEYLKEIEEDYQERRRNLEEKADKRLERRRLRELSI